MIMPKNFLRLMKSQASGGRSRHSQLIFQSSSITQSSSTVPLRKAFSSAVSAAGACFKSFDQSGLPVKRSASHQTSPASSASRSVSDICGKTPRAQEKIGFVVVSRRKLMGDPLGGSGLARFVFAHDLIGKPVPTFPDHANVALRPVYRKA